jgi:hypothetical protein
LVTPSLVRAPELKNADILANVSRQRIEVNSASSERPSDKRFEYIENLQQIIWTAFGSKLGQTAKLDGAIFFAKGWLCR